MKKLNIVLFAVVLSVLVLAPLVASAAVLPNPTPPISGAPITLSEIEDIINQVARFLIAVALVIAVIFLIYGGIRWMAAGADEEAATNAKKIIWQGIVGAAIILAVGVILSTLSGVVARTFFST